MNCAARGVSTGMDPNPSPTDRTPGAGPATRFSAEITAELAGLSVEERELSGRRQVIHAQIDRLYLAAPLDGSDITRLEQLEAAEREISLQRWRLYCEIDMVRASVGLRPWRSTRNLDSAA